MTAYFMIPMSPTDAPSDNFVGASLMTAFLCLCTMPDTDTSLYDYVGASLVSACLASKLRPVPSADSSLNHKISASSLITACFIYPLFCPAVLTTNSSHLGNVSAMLMTALFYLCPMLCV
jgi:hypothetical protein